MSKGINSMKLNNKSSKKVQVYDIASVTGNSGTYVEMGVATHNQYNSEVSMAKSKYLFDTENNVDLFNVNNENVDFTRFEVIGQEPMICGCIKIHDIFNFYTNGCIQQFYECFCESHSASESITLARFLSAIGIEVWRNVTCFGGIYKGKYKVSNLGNVLSLNRKKDAKLLKPFDGGKPCYLYVTLCQKGIKQNVRVNRLVALTFYGEPTEKLDACHSNANSHDNRLFNLTFGTRSYNMLNPITQNKAKETLKAKANKADKESTATAAE